MAGRVQLFDPNKPLAHQIYLKLGAKLEISDNLNLWSVYSQDISNDFDVNRISDSVLPHVRNYFATLFDGGSERYCSLYVEHRRSLTNNIHSRQYAGILEVIFGNRLRDFITPLLRSFRIWRFIKLAKQRGFRKLFSHRDYETVIGHLSVYYASSFNDLDFALHCGRYLAKDKGVLG